jgi:hypothetical protein
VTRAVDDGFYGLVIAAAQAAGPCPPGEGAAWARRVQGLAVDLHLAAQQARADIERLEQAHPFAAFLEKVDVEESSRRGLLTLVTASGQPEHIRTEQEHTDRGRAMIDRARALAGRWVLVFRLNEMVTRPGQPPKSVRMLAHLMDLGSDGSVPGSMAKKMVIRAAGDDVEKARRAWEESGLPAGGPVSAGDVERAIGAASGEA